MENYEKKSRIPKLAWIVGGGLAIVLVIWAAFYVFDFRVRQDINTLTKPDTETDESVMVDGEKEEVLGWYETTIDKLEDRVDVMEKDAIENGNSAVEGSLVELETQLDTLRSQYKQLKHATQAEWIEFKNRYEATRMQVEEKLQNDYRDYSVSK